MSEVTLKAIEELLDLKLDEKFDAKLEPIQKILNQHSLSLDLIVKQTADWNAEMAVMRERMRRYEEAMKLLAKKMNLAVDIKKIIES